MKLDFERQPSARAAVSLIGTGRMHEPTAKSVFVECPDGWENHDAVACSKVELPAKESEGIGAGGAQFPAFDRAPARELNFAAKPNALTRPESADAPLSSMGGAFVVQFPTHDGPATVGRDFHVPAFRLAGKKGTGQKAVAAEAAQRASCCQPVEPP
jgi:hypothetical protein